MAETNSERRTFKWGDQEYLLDDLLNAHREYENDFYEFAQKEGGYDQNSLVGLRESVLKKINAAKEGRNFGSDGTLDDDKVDNVTVTVPGKGWFKKDKYYQQDNTAGAGHYMWSLVKQLKPHKKDKTPDKGKWDISKHGLEAYLTGQGLNAKDIFEKYDLQDENDPDAPRSFNARRALLLTHLGKYKTWLEGKGFDFTKNDNDWDDDFGTTLSDLITNYDQTDINALSAALRKLGAGDAYTTAFTSDKWDMSKTNEELKADKEAREKKKKAEQEAAYLKEWEDHAYQSRRESTPVYYRPVDLAEGTDFRQWYGDLNEQQRKEHGTYLGVDNVAWNNAWKNFTNSLKGGAAYNDKNTAVLLQGALYKQPHLFLDLGNNQYLIKDSMTEDGQGTVYDAKSGYTDTVFLGDLAQTNADVKKVYKQLAYEWINKKHGTDYNDRSYVFQEGGQMIPKHLYGSQVAFNWETTDDIIKPKAEASGNTVQRQKAQDNYMDSDNASADNAATGWDGKAKARLGYAIADLTSAVAAFVPGYGTAVSAVAGLGSTFGNFFTDMADDAVSAGDMWKNFGMNLGMDVLGLIPGGGAASKMGKILKTLKTTVPIIIATPGVATMLANSPEIAKSWKKAFDGDPEAGGSKMTYQDYMNILQVLNVAAGTTNIARNAYKASKNSVKNSDKIAVDVTVKTKTGKPGVQRKALVLEGEDAARFREANAEGKAQEFIDQIEGGNKYIVNETTVSNRGKFWGRDDNGDFHLFNQNPFGRTNSGRARVFAVRQEAPTYKVVRGKKVKVAGKEYAETGRWDADLTGKDLVSMKGKTNLETWKATQQKSLDADFNTWRAKAEAYKKKTDMATATQQRIDSDIATHTTNKADIDAQIAAQERIITAGNSDAARIQDWINNGGVIASDNAITAARQKIADLEAKRAAASKSGKKRLKKQIRKQEKIIADAEQAKLDNSPQAVLDAQAKVTNATAEKSRLQVETDKLQKMLDRLGRQKTFVDRRVSTHSDAYNSINNFKPIKKTFNDVEYTFDVDASLKNLDGLYKQGGSINRNKINKFLNYGKG